MKILGVILFSVIAYNLNGAEQKIEPMNTMDIVKSTEDPLAKVIVCIEFSIERLDEYKSRPRKVFLDASDLGIRSGSDPASLPESEDKEEYKRRIIKHDDDLRLLAQASLAKDEALSLLVEAENATNLKIDEIYKKSLLGIIRKLRESFDR